MEDAKPEATTPSERYHMTHTKKELEAVGATWPAAAEERPIVVGSRWGRGDALWIVDAIFSADVVRLTSDKGGLHTLSESSLLRQYEWVSDPQPEPKPSLDFLALTQDEQATVRGEHCYYCEKGFPLKSGMHFATQALGMIPDTPCSMLIRAAEGVTLEPGEYEDVDGAAHRLRTPTLMTVEAVQDFGRWVFRFGGTRRDWVTAVRRVEAKPEAKCGIVKHGSCGEVCSFPAKHDGFHSWVSRETKPDEAKYVRCIGCGDRFPASDYKLYSYEADAQGEDVLRRACTVQTAQGTSSAWSSTSRRVTSDRLQESVRSIPRASGLLQAVPRTPPGALQGRRGTAQEGGGCQVTAPKIMGVELPERAICRYPDDLLPWKLEPHYSRNVAAMTAEGLHSKAEIAMQLAWRDQRIAELDTALARAAAWIPRTDCLPKPGDEIVARSALYEPVAGWIEVDQGSPDGLALVRRHGLSTAFAVFTHWMPIPPEWKIAEPASVSVNIKALKEHTG